MKKIILGIAIGTIISGTVGVLAATIVSSTIVTYQDKSVNTALDELYDSVNLLKTKGNAEANQILTGKKAIVKGTEITGTMANRGNLNWNPSSSTTYTVPAGYYSGGTISSSNAYSKGVTDADNRINSNSASWKNGYATGINGRYTINFSNVITETRAHSTPGNNRITINVPIGKFALVISGIGSRNGTQANTPIIQVNRSNNNINYLPLMDTTKVASGGAYANLTSRMIIYDLVVVTAGQIYIDYNLDAQLDLCESTITVSLVRISDEAF